ncbi:sensor histidine kinase [Yoonia litorea]|uniref:PAS domain S-box-containing protein n=1 Tax=Yoonia litorea TaxID=1123755 RepID=A0A1I6MHN5_9RHOB|nr:PAS domain-containing protein [Yoonia litorea]SFS15163.1 PAS domain S-box-containing protein [Yoonia litorea]
MDRKSEFAPGDMSHSDAISLFGASGLAMVITNPRLEDNPIIYVNSAFEDLTGYKAAMALGRNCRFLQGEGARKKDVDALRKAVSAGKDISMVLTNERANGEEFRNALLISPILDEETGEPEYFVGLQSEVAAGDQGKVVLALEDTIAEIQHRVKNHLAMILGLIRIKSRKMSEGEDLKDIGRRIESLQLLYEEMSAAGAEKNEDQIQLGSYLGRVGNAIAHLDGRPGVRVNIDVEPIMMQTDNAVRIGLIVSEVLTNAMQHAFDGQSSGLVELIVRQTDDGGLRAIVSDDGIGIPEGTEWPDEGGLGGQIISGLCAGLNASLNVGRGAVGTIVTLEVPNARATL